MTPRRNTLWLVVLGLLTSFSVDGSLACIRIGHWQNAISSGIWFGVSGFWHCPTRVNTMADDLLMSLYPLPAIHPKIADLLQLLRKDLIVIGSVARRDHPPNDIDIWLNSDGWIGDVERHERNRRVIRQSGLQFDSAFPGNWSFSHLEYPPISVELMTPTDIQVSFATVKRRSREFDVGGVWLRVAPPQLAGEKAIYRRRAG
jgi:hypothetical protein